MQVGRISEPLASQDLAAAATQLAKVQHELGQLVHEMGLSDLFNDIYGEVHKEMMSQVMWHKEDAQRVQQSSWPL